MKNFSKATALLGTAALLLTVELSVAAPKTIPGWPAYISMGAIGGPSVNDNFGGKPVDVVFKYAGVNGDGDPGIIDPPSNALRMTAEMQTLSATNQRAMRVAIVEYTAQMSGGAALDDFSNNGTPATNSGGTYIMARHFITLGSDALALNDKPVVYNGQTNYGTLIVSPDLLGFIQQQSGASVPNPLINQVNAALPANQVNLAVDQALCFLTTPRTYVNTFDPNGGTGKPYQRTYNGTPVVILEQMLADGYPAYSVEGQTDPFWNTAKNNLIGGTGSTYSQVGTWFNGCVSSPTYSAAAYPRPNFPAGFEGWVQANNWIIRTMSPKGRVTFGWQENPWPVTNGFWMHQDFANDSAIAANYSTPIGDWLQANAPSAITTGALGANYVPDYFVFDRYEFDDSAAPGSATLYSARSWDNFLTGVGLVSKRFDNIPIMLWQIPGGHIPYNGEANPEYLNPANPAAGYVFSTAPVYFFGDSNLQAGLANIVKGSSSGTPNVAVGAYQMNCTDYRCPTGYNYQQYLLYYKGLANNYNWASGNGRLAFAASNNVFSILWGGGNTTNVIKNFSNPDDHGWLSNKIITYYQSPTSVTSVPGATQAPHDFNGDAKNDIFWRNTGGSNAIWLMNGTNASVAVIGGVDTSWTPVGQRDFDGDGKTDILWRNTGGSNAIWFMDGATVKSVALIGGVATNWSVAGTADFNGDGKGDILWRNTDGTLAMWLMNGSTVASVAVLGNVGTNWSIVGTADFDGDGKGDLLWRNTAGNNAIWLMNGTSVTSATVIGGVATNWSVAGTGDFNGDGKGDILWRNSDGTNAIWLMNGTVVSSVALIGGVGTTWSVASNGDYNGDGRSDIFWREAGGSNYIWYMNGTTVSAVANLGGVATNWSVQNAGAN